jgi:glycosyltransferase involved in cell wall biosynthesis
MKKVSIVIPVYNEENTILIILKKVNEEIKKIKEFLFEIIVVNDFSNDNTLKLLENNKNLYTLLINNSKNLGKGFCIKNSLSSLTGDIVLIQDGDLEYLPIEYPKLLLPFIKFEADAVYGSRFKNSEINKVLLFWHSIANKLITLFCNIFSDYNLTDVETGFKVFKVNILKKMNLVENSFAFEIEATLKLSKIIPKINLYEVGVNYFGRTYEEGKKIGIKDAFIALICILKYAFIKKIK